MSTPDTDFDLDTLSEEERSILSELRQMNMEEEVRSAQEEADKAESSSKDKPEFTDEELLYIFDNLLTQGGYKETVQVGGRIKITWRTRTVRESGAITRIVDGANMSTIVATNNLLNLLTMSYALVNFNGQDFDKKSLADKQKFWESLPEPLMVEISRTLAKFDYKVAKASEKGRDSF